MSERLIEEAQTEYVARLAHLSFNEEELVACTRELASILDYMQEINKLDTAGVEPTTHVLPLVNVLREDKVGETLSNAEALMNAPESENGSFKVPKIL